MSYFSVGAFSLILPLFFVVLYVVIRQGRRLIAWMENEPGPHERAGAFIVFLAIGGFLLGSMFQAMYDETEGCRASGAKIMHCLLAPRTSTE
jgi:hypothetical protein